MQKNKQRKIARERNADVLHESGDRGRYHVTCSVSVAMDTNVNALHIATCNGDEQLIATALTNQTINIYRRENLNKIATLKGHIDKITGLKFSKSDPNTLYSSSLDGTVRIWDLRQKASVQEFHDDTDGKRKCLSSFDVSCNEAFLTAGTELIITDVYLLFWDVRSPKPLGCYTESHTDDITRVVFDGDRPNTMASGSTDGLINIFDISQPNEEDALQSTLNTESSVDIFNWYQRGKYIACLTHVETVQIWDVEDVEIVKSYDRNSVAKELKLVRPPSQFIDLAIDAGMGLQGLVAASSENNDAILIGIDDNRLTEHHVLNGAHKSSMICAAWNVKDEWALTADEGALLCHWTK